MTVEGKGELAEWEPVRAEAVWALELHKAQVELPVLLTHLVHFT